jgi:hypothetical protein
MANNYVQFSEGLLLESSEEKAWLQDQLEPVELAVLTNRSDSDERPPCYIVPPGADDYREGYDPAGTFPKFLCDTLGLDYGFEGAGFEVEWEDDEEPGHVVFFAEEMGCPERLGWLIQKYLQTFRPDETWSLTWSETCSRPRCGEFGGGGMLVTADRLIFLNAHEFVQQQQERFEAIGRYGPDDEHPDHSSRDWASEVGAGQTRLGYWDWVLNHLQARQGRLLEDGYWKPGDDRQPEPEAGNGAADRAR